MTVTELLEKRRDLEIAIINAAHEYCSPDPPEWRHPHAHTAERSAQLQTDLDDALDAYRKFLHEEWPHL